MSHVLGTIREKRDALLSAGHVYLYTFEDFDVGFSGHPVDMSIYPGVLPAITGMGDTSWHLHFIYRTQSSQTSSRTIHGLLLGATGSKGSIADKRGYEKYWPHARATLVGAGGSSYTSYYVQYHAFNRGVGIGVVYGKVMQHLTVDVFTIEESYYEPPEHSRLNTG